MALAEMCMAGVRGANLNFDEDVGSLFGEDQSRYLIATTSRNLEPISNAAKLANIPVRIIGRVGGDTLTLNTANAISVSELIEIHERWLPTYTASN